jgi:hypothetical protein
MSEPTDEPDLKERADCGSTVQGRGEGGRKESRILGELDPDAIREHTYPCQDCDGGCEVCDE